MADVQSTEQNTATTAGSEEEHAEQEHAGQEHASPANAASRPWYASPWFWALIFFIVVLALLTWLFWLQWKAHEARLSQDAALVLVQEEKNASLAAEIARLKALLAEEPCIIQEHLQDQPLVIPPSQEASNTHTVPVTPNLDSDSASNSAKPQVDTQAKEQSTAEAPPPPPTVNTQKDAAATSDSSSSSTMAQQLENATVLVLSDEAQGLQMGTGFFIAPGIVLTNQHVVGSGKAPLYVVGTFEGTAVKAKLLAISPNAKRDYAVLQVPVTTVTPLQFTTQVQRTEKVSTWGFPSAVTNNDPKFKNLMNGSDTKAPDVIYSEGTVSVIQEQNPSLIVHTAIVSQGNSGGPLVNAQGQVVGINPYIHMDKESYRQSSLSIVTEDILAFLQEHAIPYTVVSGNKE